MTVPSENQKLYDLGRSYARRVKRRLPSHGGEGRALAAVAKDAGEGVKEVRIAMTFAKNVDAINKAVRGARVIILGGENPHFTPGILAEVCRKAGARSRPKAWLKHVMVQASAGLHPLAPTPPAELPAQLARSHYDLCRLRKARDFLERIGKATGRTGGSLPAAVRADLAIHAAAIRTNVDAIGLLLGREKREPFTTPARLPVRDTPDVCKWMKAARELVEGTTADLLRAAHTRPVGAARAELARAVSEVDSAAEGIRVRLHGAVKAVPPPEVSESPGGPFGTPGTYVIVLRAEKPAVVRLARLGTFWLPGGFFLYVGSAFAAGGVAARTTRHVEGTGPRLWGADHLRGFARPVERWWTHHREKVECRWARALAGMPACSCPAPLAGASDCNRCQPPRAGGGEEQRCPAHLFHAEDRPSVEAFADQLGASGSGGYRIHRQVGSGARGWPHLGRLDLTGGLDELGLFG
jgi:Uri superfamily endonuclease